MMRDVFKDGGKRLATGPVNQALQSCAKECEGAGCVGIPDQTFIFAPASITLPVSAFATPVSLDHLGHGLRAFGCEAPTADKMPGKFFLARNWRLPSFFLGGGPVARFKKLFGFGKVAGLRIGAHSAQRALDGSTVVPVG